MKRQISGNLKEWSSWAIDKSLTIGAYAFVTKHVVLELIAIASVVYGVGQIYSPAAWIVLGVAIWFIARGLEITDATE